MTDYVGLSEFGEEGIFDKDVYGVAHNPREVIVFVEDLKLGLVVRSSDRVAGSVGEVVVEGVCCMSDGGVSARLEWLGQWQRNSILCVC